MSFLKKNKKPTTPQGATSRQNIRKKKKKKQTIIVAIIAVLLLVASGVTYGVVTYMNYNKTIANMNQNKLPTAATVNDVKAEPFSILFIGLGTNGNDGEATLADSINLITINPINNYAEVIAIPRDSYLPFGASCEWGINMYDKVTHTTGISPDCLQTTLEQVFEIDINYYVSVDFKGFVSIVDSLGGVKMHVPDLRAGFEAYPGDPSDGMYLDPALKNGGQWCEHDSNRAPFAVCFTEFGDQTVMGEQALALARSRHYDSDYGRSIRQTELIKAIIDKATGVAGVASINSLLAAAGDTVETNIPADQFMSFVSLADKMLSVKDGTSTDAFQMRTTQLAGASYQFNGQRISGQNITYSVVPRASVEEIRLKIARVLSDGEVVLSPGDFDFSYDQDAPPSNYSYDETIDKGEFSEIKSYRS